MDGCQVDWVKLRASAVEIMQHAYAPYSKFPVGAAGLVDDGRIVLGCNVENAAYGVALCAECGMVSQLHATGGGRLVAMACVNGNGDALLPCGRCRQLLWEQGGPDMLVDAGGGPLRMADLLPHGFGPADLAAITVEVVSDDPTGTDSTGSDPAGSDSARTYSARTGSARSGASRDRNSDKPYGVAR